MTDKPKKAKIFKRPSDDRATKKVSAIPAHLLKDAQRPDGVGATKVEREERKKGLAEDSGPEGLDSVEISDGGLFDELFGDLEDDES